MTTTSSSIAFAVKLPETVRIGLYKKSRYYRGAFRKSGQTLNDWAETILKRITCSQEEVDLDLVVLSARNLGFQDDAKYSDICAEVPKLGLELCPAEVGLALRLQYTNQSPGEYVLVGMAPIFARNGGTVLFQIEHGRGELMLRGVFFRLDSLVSPDTPFVFVKPRR